MNKTRLFGALGFAALFFIYPSRAHDYNWGFELGDMRNPITHKLCCGYNDCGIVMPPPKATKAGWAIHGEVMIGANGQGRRVRVDETIPYNEVLPSQDGYFWRCHSVHQHFLAAVDPLAPAGVEIEDGERRCFFAPPQNL